MIEFKYRCMCFTRSIAKKVLGRSTGPMNIRFVDIDESDLDANRTVLFQRSLNYAGEEIRCPMHLFFPVENACATGTNLHLRSSFSRANRILTIEKAEKFTPHLWRNFIDRAEIPAGFKNGGLKYAGYITSGRESWCLPSWIWTNAAIVRYLCDCGDADQATALGNILLAQQDVSGGWVVRSDYSNSAEIPVLAPNDSAYIANNAFLTLFALTQREEYLAAAEICAGWIIETARKDGLVWTGFDKKNELWLTNHTIVDIGFTAALFANLFKFTGKQIYRTFLKRFVETYVDCFFDPRKRSFATSIDKVNKRVGGRFARGQAWALEGLIPAYTVLGTSDLKSVIQATVQSIISEQLPNGGWAYNFDKAYLGEDCKGVPVLAKALLDWHRIEKDDALVTSARKAIDWCVRHTSLSGASKGGIFSFNAEGAVVHNFNTKTAFVYSSAYALEVWKELGNELTSGPA